MLGRLWEWLSRHIKMAWKSVFFNFKQYCCFFAAILIFQLLFGIMWISGTNNNSVAKQQIKDEYDYHYVIYNLTQDQYNYLANYKRPNVGTMDKIKQLYVILEDKTVERMNTREGKPEYDVYIRFGKLDRETGEMADDATVASYCKDFEQYYIKNLQSIDASYGYQNFKTENTLLLEYQNRVASNNTTRWIIVGLLFILSVILLIVIYDIRLNQYKFTYGVYMTYGADFKMLFTTAFWEMFIIMLVTFIPSVLLSTLIVYLIYAPSGFAFEFSGSVFFFGFIFSFLVVLISVAFPMKRTSTRAPMSLIITEDNSNLVTSPRKSFNLLGKSFPGHYEMYSLWRFRKYNIHLLRNAILFCALFICGLYLASVYTTDMNYPRTQYTVTIDPNNTGAGYDSQFSRDIQKINDDFRNEFAEELGEYGDDFANEFDAITGLEATGNATPTEEDLDYAQSPVTEARYNNSFMLVDKSNVKGLSWFGMFDLFVYDEDDAYSPYQGDGSYKVTNSVLYKSVDADTKEDFLNFLSQYEIEGDPEKIFESNGNTHYCIIGDSVSNLQTFSFDEGDEVALSTFQGAVAKVDSNLTGNNLLRKQIKNYKYGYTTLEVCAVIKDIPSGSVPLYMMNDTYEAVTGRSSAVTALNIYTYSPDPTDKNVFQFTNVHVDYLETALRNMIAADGASKIGSIVVSDTNQNAENHIKSDEHYSELFVAVSVLILCISPIIWFFSQIQYYFKREKEFNVIQSMGANGSDIRKIYLLGGLSMAALSFIVSVILSYLASFLMFMFINVVLPNFSGEYVRFTFYMPWYALVISVVMSVACGFFSAFIPYKSYFKNRYSLENGGSGVQDDE